MSANRLSTRTRRRPFAADRRATEADPPNPMLVIISGPSGVGKDTIIEALQKRGHRPAYHYVVTCTTRAGGPNEIDGVSYNFVTRPRVRGPARRRRAARGQRGPRQLVRHAASRRSGGSGGRPARHPQDRRPGRPSGQGLRSGGALLIFVVPPSLDTLVEHLKARRTESAEQLEIRQRNAAIELARKDDYDYVVVNEEGRVDVTAERIEEIIEQEERRGSAAR
jgi:guanylate kinase